MKALVTGAGGQLGKALIATIPEGWECIAADRARLDLCDPQAIASLVMHERPDYLINAAAYTAVDKAESDVDTAFAVNATAVGHLADAAAKAGAMLVQVSTDYVFDGQSTRPYRPGDVRNPLSVYGRSKAAGENAAGPDALIVRTSWLYDSGGANFLRTMLRMMSERDEIRVVDDQIGAPTWARELAGVIWQLTQRGKSGVYHYSDCGSASWHDLAVATYEEGLRLGLVDREVSIVPIPTDAFPQQARRPAYSLLDSSATLAELGRTPIDWRDNLQRMLKVDVASR